MKKLILLLSVVSITSLTAIAQNNKCNEKGLAIVERINGIYVYEDGQKVFGDYKVLGYVKGKSNFSKTFGTKNSYSELKRKAVENAIKQYPETEAIIFYYNGEDGDRAEAIIYIEPKS